MTAIAFVKDPGARLDYQVDWTDWLGTDTITTSAWSVPAGLTKETEAFEAAVATVWLSGGTAQTDFTVTNAVTTAGGRVDQRSFLVRVREK